LPDPKEMPTHRLLVTDPDILSAYSEDASGLIGRPDAVARPVSEEEIVEIVRHCRAGGIGLTPQGLRSSMVGGPLAFGGVALSCERMARLIDLDVDRKIAIIEPGMNTGDFKKAIAGSGLFYPPDPTSENESTIGGNVATNASGSRTYLYGGTRRYVRSLRVVLGDGRVTEITRSRALKNTVGYYGFQDPIDLFIGSEGTLGIITRVTLDLLPTPPGFFSAMAFFTNLADALSLVVAADRARVARVGGIGGTGGIGGISPRCLELFDENSLGIIRPEAGRLHIPGEARAAIFLEQECDPAAADQAFESWFGFLESNRALADYTIVAANEEAQAEIRKLRHALPATMNERGAEARARGGLKVSTDWCVPLEAMPQTIEDATLLMTGCFPGFFIRYGHVGNGHPHFNLLANDPDELAKAREATHRMALLAVERGGSVTAEHGIGKVKREYVKYQYPEWVVDGMRALKRVCDPDGILSPGNIFET
jgi:glycolate oxidase